MSKRSLNVGVAFGLLVSLAVTTPSRAGSYLVQVSTSFSASDSTFADTISQVTLTYSNSEYSGPLNTMSSLSFIGSAVTAGPPLAYVTPTLSSNAGAGTFTLNFSPSVFTVGGGISFDTIATTNNPIQLASDITFQSYTIVTAVGTDKVTIGPTSIVVLSAVLVPEPASMSLLGIGMAGLFAFRRYFRRSTNVQP